MTVIHNDDDDDDADADDGAIMVWLEKQDRWCVLFLGMMRSMSLYFGKKDMTGCVSCF